MHLTATQSFALEYKHRKNAFFRTFDICSESYPVNDFTPIIIRYHEFLDLIGESDSANFPTEINPNDELGRVRRNTNSNSIFLIIS